MKRKNVSLLSSYRPIITVGERLLARPERRAFVVLIGVLSHFSDFLDATNELDQGFHETRWPTRTRTAKLTPKELREKSLRKLKALLPRAFAAIAELRAHPERAGPEGQATITAIGDGLVRLTDIANLGDVFDHRGARDVEDRIALALDRLKLMLYGVGGSRRSSADLGIEGNQPPGNPPPPADGATAQDTSVQEKPQEVSAGEKPADVDLSQLPPSRQKARRAYDWALGNIPGAENMTVAELFNAVKTGDAADMLPPTSQSFERYLREAGVERYSKQQRRASRSVRRAEEI
jgi:hypothetical protein